MSRQEARGRNQTRVPGVSVYPRGKSWAYLVTGEPDLLTGKKPRAYQGGFATESEAWAEALRVKSDVDATRTVRTPNVTVGQFMVQWLDSVRPAIKPTTYANYVDNINAYVVPIIGERKLKDVSTPVLNAFYVRLLESGRTKRDTNGLMYEYWRLRLHQRNGQGPQPSEIAKACKVSIYAARAAVLRYRKGRTPTGYSAGLSGKSVRNVHRLLHRAFADAVGWQYLTVNPAAHARLPRMPRSSTHNRRPTPWTLDELGAWLRVALTDRFAGMWVLAATTGMRRSELAGVARAGLDLDAGTLAVAATRVVVAGRAEDSDGKSDAGERTISLDPFTVAALRKHLAVLDEERAAFGLSYPRHGRLMCFEDGRLLHPDTVTRRFNRLVDLAGVRTIRLHDIRHTYVTLAMDEGVSPKIVSDRVGHANVNVTQQIYTHRSVGRDRHAAATLAGVIEQAIQHAAKANHRH